MSDCANIVGDNLFVVFTVFRILFSVTVLLMIGFCIFKVPKQRELDLKFTAAR